jgi:hypothetical protein
MTATALIVYKPFARGTETAAAVDLEIGVTFFARLISLCGTILSRSAGPSRLSGFGVRGLEA